MGLNLWIIRIRDFSRHPRISMDIENSCGSTSVDALVIHARTVLMKWMCMFSGADLCRVLVEAEHLAMEEIMSTVVTNTDIQPPVAVVFQRHLVTVLQRLSPSVKVQ